MPVWPGCKYNIGDRVRIKRDSEHHHQHSGIGTVGEEARSSEKNKWMQVQFQDPEYHNVYRESDLEQAFLDERLEPVLTSLSAMLEGIVLESLAKEGNEKNGR